MSESVEYRLNAATIAQIVEHFSNCNAEFVLSLGKRIDINSYAEKIIKKAVRFEAWNKGALVGLVAAYCNDSETHSAYITNVSVVQRWQGKRIASQLLGNCIKHMKESGFDRVDLEVNAENASVIRLYEKMGFRIDNKKDQMAFMRLDIEVGAK